MATREAILAIKVITDSSQAATGLDAATSKAGKFQRGVASMTGPAIAAGAAVLAIGKKAVDSAALLQQSQGAVKAVFGSEAAAVEKYASTAAKAMGLSAAEYNNYAALVGTALKGAGMSTKQAVEESNKVMQRAADLSALYGGTTAEAVESINAAVSRSEFDPLEKYGVSLTATAVNAELAARGQDNLTGKQAEAAKKAIILEEIYGKTADAAGQYARESDTASGSAATASAEWENASAALGTALLPAVTAVTQALTKMASYFAKHTTLLQVLLGAVLAFSAGILILRASFAVVTLAVKLFGKEAVKAWLMALGPIGLVIAAVAAVVIVIVLLWKKSQTFRTVVLAVWNAVKSAAKTAGSAIKTAFLATWNAIKTAAKAVGSAVRTVFNAIRGAVSTVVGIVATLIARIKAIKVPGAVKSAIDAIRNTVSNLIGKVAELIGKIKGISVPGTVKTAFDAVKSAADRILGVIRDIISAVGNIIPKINWPDPPSWLPGVKAAPKPPATTAPAVAGRRGVAAPRVGGFGAPAVSTSTGGGGLIQINVTGALDPEAVARQINRILTGHAVRVGLRTS